MATDQLLIDFLTTELPLTELARRHNLSLPELLAWADSPATQRLFDDLARIARQRSALIAAESSVKALGNLAQLSLALAKRSELANLPGGPRPPSITALETSRKACAALLRIVPKPGAHQRPQSCANSNGAPERSDTPPRSNPVTRAAPHSNPADVPIAQPSRATDNPSPRRAGVQPLTCSPVPPVPESPPARLASLAGTIPEPSNRLSPSASRLSPLPCGGIPTD